MHLPCIVQAECGEVADAWSLPQSFQRPFSQFAIKQL